MGKQEQVKYVDFDPSWVNLLALLVRKDHSAYNENDPTHPSASWRRGVRVVKLSQTCTALKFRLAGFRGLLFRKILFESKESLLFFAHDPSHPSASWRRGVRPSEDKFLQNCTVLKVSFYPLKS